MYIDTHTHIYADVFEKEQFQAVQRAISNKVEVLMLPNIDIESISKVLQLSDAYPNHCFPMMGLHPCSVKEDFLAVLAQMKPYFEQRKFYGVGETGIDLYWDNTFLEEQKEAFKIQIEWAKTLNLPLIIHARDAFQEIFEVLDELNDERLKGIFHCFTGNEEEAQKILSYQGFSFGIGGVVTYKNSHLPEVLPLIPIEKILLETDAPYLPPVPYRGKTNESAYLVHIAEKLSDIYQLKLSEIANITTNNAQQLFKLFEHGK
jgi:TatD DNase family protein